MSGSRLGRSAAALAFAVAALSFGVGGADAQTEGELTEAENGNSGGNSLAAETEPGQVVLTILHSNDGESKLLPDPDGGYAGVARFVASMRELQAKAATWGPVVTLNAGDSFLPSPQLAVSLGTGSDEMLGPFYDAVAMSGLFDAFALGNHEFDFGPEVAARFIDSISPPVPFLGANLDVSDEPALAALAQRDLLVPSTVLDAGGERVGVIGVVTPGLASFSSPRNAKVSPVLAGVQAEAERLAAAGVNKVILLSHLQDLNEELALVPKLRGVDVVVAGGGNELLAEPGGKCLGDEEPDGPYPTWVSDADGIKVPVVTTPGGYRCIGQLVVTFDDEGSLVSAKGSSVGVSLKAEPDPKVHAEVVEPLAAALSELNATEVGRSQVALDGRRQVLRTRSANVGSLMADAVRARATERAADFGVAPPTVAVVNGGGLRNDSVLPAGPISVGTTWDIAPFGDGVMVGLVPRATLHELFERALGALPAASGRFPQVSGMKVTYDPGGAARQFDQATCTSVGAPGDRVRSLTLDDGTPIVRDGRVVPGPPVALATLDFLARGGDCYPLGDIGFTRLSFTYQQALADYIAQDLEGVVTAKKYPRDGGNRVAALAAGSGYRQEAEEAGDLDDGFYTIQPGDYLRSLAQRFLGSASAWPKIFELNQGKPQPYGGPLSDPDIILVGWRLELPTG